MKKIAMSMAAAMAAGMAAWAAIPQKITYHGVLGLPPDTAMPLFMEMTFSLYDSAVSNAPAVWSQTLGNVSVASNGAFFVELSDESGKLANELAKMKGAPELGLTLGGDDLAGELKPRRRLENTVRAARASRAKVADRFVAERGLSLGALQTEKLYAGQLTVVDGVLTVDGECGLVAAPYRELGGAGSEVSVRDVRPLHPPHFVRAALAENYTTASAPCDLLLTYEDGGRVFNVIVPRGGVIAAQQGTTNMVISATEFGN